MEEYNGRIDGTVYMQHPSLTRGYRVEEYNGRMDGTGCSIYYSLEDTGWENIMEE